MRENKVTTVFAKCKIYWTYVDTRTHIHHVYDKQARQISAAEEYEILTVVIVNSLCWASLPLLKKWGSLTFPLVSWNIDFDYEKLEPSPI